MKKVVLRFSLDGIIEVQGLQEGAAESVEKEFSWLLRPLGDVEVRGHKPLERGLIDETVRSEIK